MSRERDEGTAWARSLGIDVSSKPGWKIDIRLATILAWLTYVEKKTKLVFHRDRPGITSNVKGGAKAVAAWLTSVMVVLFL